MENFEKDKSPYEKAIEKSNTLGFFSLTAEDHKAMGSSPDSILKENPGKAAYEVMSDETILSLLNAAVDALYDKRAWENGYAEAQREFLLLSIPFLESVERLPDKFKDFDLDSLRGS